jgi:hypothetical protein
MKPAGRLRQKRAEGVRHSMLLYVGADEKRAKKARRNGSWPGLASEAFKANAPSSELISTLFNRLIRGRVKTG